MFITKTLRNATDLHMPKYLIACTFTGTFFSGIAGGFSLSFSFLQIWNFLPWSQANKTYISALLLVARLLYCEHFSCAVYYYFDVMTCRILQIIQNILKNHLKISYFLKLLLCVFIWACIGDCLLRFIKENLWNFYQKIKQDLARM